MGGKIEKKATPVAKKTGAGKAASAAKKASSVKATAAKKTAAAKTEAKSPVKASAKTVASKAASKAAAKPTASKAEPEKFSAWANAKTVKKTKKASAEDKGVLKAATKAEDAEKKLAAAKQIDPASQREKKEVQDYGDDKIKHLDALEHIRLRSGMYIGRLGNGNNENDGIYVLIKEVIDNSIDEFIVGFGKQIEVSVVDGRVKVRDYGRGIPLGKVVECVSQINTGAKYNDDVFQFSVGMNGVGTKAVNALSSFFRVVSVRDGKCTDAVFEKGKLISQKTGALKNPQKNGTYFEFVPDEEIFGKYMFNMEYVEKRMWNYAYLNPGLTLKLNGVEYKSDRGLLDLLNKELGGTDDSKQNELAPLYEIGDYDGDHLKFAFTHTNAYGENYFSFVNGQYTSDGGTHLAAFKEGFRNGIRDFFGVNYAPEDIREGMTAAVLVKIKDPVFESQTKNKLGNTDIKDWIVAETQSGLDAWLHKNPKAAERIKQKIEHNEKMRTELADVKKKQKEAAKKMSIRIPKLDDCKYHLEDGPKGEDSMIFITEGDSAAGVMTHSRDAGNQAIFRLKGKPENMYGKRQSDIYNNDELHQLMCALGIEDSAENLKYSKIVIATDADNDGFHIRNLLLTFFLGYFEELVTTGRVFILETPLFRVRTKKENIYCYSEAERDAAQEKLGKGSETSRFKGLGEINPSEFKQFIAPETIRLTPVEVSQLKIIPQLLAFYMGKNTPERRKFIEKNLLSNAEIDA
ncbi:toprim domain-containing protein [Treponema sp.]|uniref:toprim domain-containing protein n=1 Tax=Treponema sp. TaxID=166 RepID=UPI00298E2D87|nr:toprim domain-containing protein [Treponema sp.]